MLWAVLEAMEKKKQKQNLLPKSLKTSLDIQKSLG